MALCCAKGLCLAEFVPDGGALSVNKHNPHNTPISDLLLDATKQS